MRRVCLRWLELSALAGLLAGLLFWVLRPAPGGALALDTVTRETVAPGLELLRAGVKRGGQRAGRLVAVFADPEAARLELLLNEDKAPLEALAPDALCVINAGYFTEKFRPTGLLVSEARVLSPFVPEAGAAGSGVFVLDEAGARLLDRDEVTPSAYVRAQLALQAGPRVIEPGGRPGIRADDGARANRTVIGKDGRGRLALVVVHNAASGRAAGPTLFELMHLLSSAGLGAVAPELALDFALNLDGGPSTGLALRAGAGAATLPEAHRVLSALALHRRP